MKVDDLNVDSETTVVKYSEFRQNLKTYCEQVQSGANVALLRTAKGTDNVLDSLMIISKEKYDDLSNAQWCELQSKEDIALIHKKLVDINQELRMARKEREHILQLLSELTST